MKKLFVSVPMKGRKEEEIRKSIVKMHRIAEAIIGEPLELIDSYVEDNPPKDSKEAVWFLSKSLEKLATADVFITIRDAYIWNGCFIERSVAERYDIKTIMVDEKDVMDDYKAVYEQIYNAPICREANPGI